MRNVILVVVKVAVSGVLLYFALNLVKVGTVVDRLSRIDPAWYALGLLALLAQTYFVALRWSRIAGQCGAHLPAARLFRFTMIANFFNQTLPSGVGGDAMRIWLVARETNWRVGTYSVFLDRVVGVVALALLVIVCLPWSLALVRDPVGRIALLTIGLGCLAGGVIFVGLAWERLRILQRWAPTRHLAATASVALTMLRSPGLLIRVGVLSALIHLMSAVAAWCAARSVAADLGLLNSIFLVLPVILISIVPISIAGWGVRESVMVAAFSYAGLPQDDGLIVSLLFGAELLLLGIAGGAIWILTTARAERSTVRDTAGRDQAQL